MGVGIIGINTKMLMEQARKEKLIQEERELIKDFQAAGKVEAKGAVTTIDEMRKAPTAAEIMYAVRNMPPYVEDKTPVMILNAATAAALRKQLGEAAEHIEMIITAAADTGTVYQVTNDELRKELLRSIAAGRRGNNVNFN